MAGRPRFAYDGAPSSGLKVTPEMQRLIDRPGYLSTERGGQRLRELYVDGSVEFHPDQLSPFGIDCFLGLVDEVRKAVEAGTAPDLEGRETPYKFGYLTLTLSGKQQIQSPPMDMAHRTDHLATLQYLMKAGCPTESEDIVGYTALMHSCINRAEPKFARALAAGAADPNHRNKFGAVALSEACMQNQVDCISVLMEYGASLDIPDADGYAPSTLYLTCGPYVVAEIQKWLRKRSGEDSLLQAKSCDFCGKSSKDTKVKLAYCSRCRLRQYCSPECQRTDWKTHKKSCHPYDAASTTVTLKPNYFAPNEVAVNTAEVVRSIFEKQNPVPGAIRKGPQSRDMSAVKEDLSAGRRFIVKVQLPTSGVGDFMIYNKKKDFRCLVRAQDNGAQYERLKKVVRDKGIMGAKAYFQAELKSKDELVLQLDVLAEQAW